MNIMRLIIVVACILVSLSAVNALNVSVNFTETVTATELESGQIDITASGSVSINNPTTTDLIHKYVFHFRDDVVFNVIYNNSNLSQYDQEMIVGEQVNPSSTINATYVMTGVIPRSNYNDFSSSNYSLLEWYSEDINFEVDRFVSLAKFERTNTSINVSERTVGVSGHNPTDFNITFDYVNLIKTNTSTASVNSFHEDTNILTAYEDFVLKPGGSFSNIYIDQYSDNYSVYWIETRLSADYNRSANRTLSFTAYVATGTSSGGGGGGGGGGSSSSSLSTPITIPDFFIAEDLTIVKRSNKDAVPFEGSAIISIDIQNPNAIEVPGITVTDRIGEHFSIIGSNNTNLTFKFDKMLPYETKTISYGVNYSNKSETGVLFIPPARLEYSDVTELSNSLSLIEDNNTNRAVLVEKHIIYLNDGLVRTYIKVTNVGNINLTDVRVVETQSGEVIEEDFRDHYKFWVIPSLEIGEEWETFYDTDIDNLNFNAPEAFIDSETKVLKTIIVNEQVVIRYEDGSSDTYLGFLIGFAVILLIMDMIF